MRRVGPVAGAADPFGKDIGWSDASLQRLDDRGAVGELRVAESRVCGCGRSGFFRVFHG